MVIILKIASELLKVLKKFHEYGYIHNDIKFDNILFGRKSSDDPIYLIDFGLSRKFMDSRTKQHLPYNNNVKF